MKLLRPDLSADLIATTDLQTAIMKDEALSGLSIHDCSAEHSKVKSLVLNDSKLLKCDLSGAKIDSLQLQDCLFERCTMVASKFANSSWHAIEVIDGRCSGIQLQTSRLKNVLFKNCKLDFANLRFARLENVIFESCVITELDLYNAELKHVAFVDCAIEEVEFSASKLKHVDLSESTIVSVRGLQGLKGATIAPEQLIQLAPYMAQEIGLIIKD